MAGCKARLLAPIDPVDPIAHKGDLELRKTGMQQRRPVMLVVLDGWGWREESADNAVRLARTPC